MDLQRCTELMSWCTPQLPVNVHQTRCVRVRNRHAQCSRCIDACPVGAIRYADNVLSVSAQACLGCGTCASACPTGAIDLKALAEADLHRACVRVLEASAERQVTLTCTACLEENGRAFDPELVVEVPCLGRVDESLPLTLAALGAQGLSLAYGDCARCACGCGAERAAEVAASANDLLGLLGSPLQANLVGELPDAVLREGEPVAAAGAAAALGGAPEQDAPEFRLAKMTPRKVLARTVPDKRKRLLKAFALMARREKPAEEPVQTELWARVEIDAQKCRSCRACAIFCPTGALEKLDAEGSFGVTHVVGTCVNCGCCRDVCKTGALTLSCEVTPGEICGGRIVPIELPAIAHPNGKHDSMFWRMKEKLGVENLYLR